jgi:transcriptional regulator of met regulon
MAVFTVIAYCVYKILSILTNKQPMRKDNDMEKETRKSLWLSGVLIAANALGLAYLFNPRKFEEKADEIKEAIKKIFTINK